MKVSLSWLQDYVHIDMDVDKLADMLTMTGLEVESVEDRYAYLEAVVVGRIAAVEPHPDARKLTICTVNTGDNNYRIVCGAPNAAVGLIAPLALPGAVLPGDLTITVSTIRGQQSQGMLCSQAELGLGTDSSGLMALDETLALGQSLNKALKLSDHVLEIGLTPNRPDCLSIMGVAREIAGFNGGAIHRPVVDPPESGGDIAQYSSVIIESPDHCPRYAARLVEDITVKPSPFWLKDRLLSIGLRPINNLVDITNFVMLETGQPLHAFDFDNLDDHRIVVRVAKPGEPFTTLDGKQRRLDSDMLMICDGRKPVAIGGVMGGLNSEIEEKTRRVLIESAYFNPTSVRKTAKRLGLSTDASHRFERGVDPHGALYALNRAAQLMVELGGGKLISGTLDTKHVLPEAPTLALSVAAANRLLGTALGAADMQNLLESIEFTVTPQNEDTLKVTAPSFRVDISRPQDLMEEIARRHGYDDIPVTFPQTPAAPAPSDKLIARRRAIRDVLKGIGFNETINYSFIHQDSPDRLRLDQNDKRRRQVAIVNPLTEDQTVMRTSLIPGLLDTVKRNLSQQCKNLRLFETGKTFIDNGPQSLPDEIEILAGLWTGERQASGWYAKPQACDFYDLKGSLETMLDTLKIKNTRFFALQEEQCRYWRRGVAAVMEINGEAIGIIGEIHPKVRDAYNLKQPVFAFELHLSRLSAHIPETIASTALPKYPSTTRDATLIVDKQHEAAMLTEQIRRMEEPLVEAVTVFDLYEGSPIPQGRKSVSLRVTYRSREKTLEDETVNLLHKTITDRLIKQFKADLPA